MVPEIPSSIQSLKSGVCRSSRRQAFVQGIESTELSMTPNALARVGSYAVIIAGLLVPAVSYAASSSPYDQSGTNPAQSNCDSKTGCASYATGDLTKAKPGKAKAVRSAASSNSPYDQTGTNPAQSNCDSKTGCASYATGDRTRVKPGHSKSQASSAQENDATAKLNQQQLVGR
jgi:hypothetical protein